MVGDARGTGPTGAVVTRDVGSGEVPGAGDEDDAIYGFLGK